jgi:hypothetical protein
MWLLANGKIPDPWNPEAYLKLPPSEEEPFQQEELVPSAPPAKVTDEGQVVLEKKIISHGIKPPSAKKTVPLLKRKI